ncbi:MAG: hypothetical protein KF791_11905 [Verrucomicrobiae bacterium]|nr:hypothetical protein [Verrucomicrobiae bacterium]
MLPEKCPPIQPGGRGNQGAYLSEISHRLARRLLDQHSVCEAGSLIADPFALVAWEHRLQDRIAHCDSIPETIRRALIQARRGQDRFKENVARFEARCRITGVFNPVHLVASHIKPWGPAPLIFGARGDEQRRDQD